MAALKVIAPSLHRLGSTHRTVIRGASWSSSRRDSWLFGFENNISLAVRIGEDWNERSG